MDINGWLAIIAVFIGILALLPSEQRRLLKLQTSGLSIFIFCFIILVALPLLILTPQYKERWPELKSIGFSWGFEPANVALLLFYGLLIWTLVKLLIVNKNRKPNDKVIDFYFELLNEKPFNEFFKFFTSQSTPEHVRHYFHFYYNLLFDPKFLQNGTHYIYQFWDELDTDSMKRYFELCLDKTNSEYYQELKANVQANTVLGFNPFLTTLIKTNLEYSISNKIQEVLYDHTIKQFKYKSQSQLYRQEHFVPQIRETEGYDLPVFYHLQFFFLLHTSAIEQNKESYFKRSFYSSIVNENVIYSPNFGQEAASAKREPRAKR